MFKMATTACLKCGRALFRLTTPITTDWAHRDGDGWPRVGCRAATWSEKTGWDDSVPRSWSATPDPTKIEVEE